MLDIKGKTTIKPLSFSKLYLLRKNNITQNRRELADLVVGYLGYSEIKSIHYAKFKLFVQQDSKLKEEIKLIGELVEYANLHSDLQNCC